MQSLMCCCAAVLLCWLDAEGNPQPDSQEKAAQSASAVITLIKTSAQLVLLTRTPAAHRVQVRWLHLTNSIQSRVQGGGRNRWRMGEQGLHLLPPCPAALAPGRRWRWARATVGQAQCTRRRTVPAQHWIEQLERHCAERMSTSTHPGLRCQVCTAPLAGQPAPHSAHGNSGKGRPFPPRISSLSSALASDPHQAASGPQPEPPFTPAISITREVLSHGIARAFPPHALSSLPPAPV